MKCSPAPWTQRVTKDRSMEQARLYWGVLDCRDSSTLTSQLLSNGICCRAAHLFVYDRLPLFYFVIVEHCGNGEIPSFNAYSDDTSPGVAIIRPTKRTRQEAQAYRDSPLLRDDPSITIKDVVRQSQTLHHEPNCMHPAFLCPCHSAAVC